MVEESKKYINSFNISFQRLVAVHYCLSYVVNNVKDEIISQMKILVYNLSKEIYIKDSNNLKYNWRNNALKFFNKSASKNYKNNNKNTNDDYTLEDIKNIDNFQSLLLNYNSNTQSEDGLQLLNIFLNPRFENEYDKAQLLTQPTKK